MKRILACVFCVSSLWMTGCGGAVKEVPALTAPGQDPPAEQQTNWQEESRNRGGGPPGAKPKTPAATK